MNRKKKMYLLGTLWGITGVLFGLFYVVRDSRTAADWIIEHIAGPIRETVGWITNVVPFSVAEVFYTAIGVGSICFLIRTVKRIAECSGFREKAFCAFWRLVALALVPAMIWTGYSWLWAIGYYGTTFQEKNGFTRSGVAKEDLAEVTAYFAERASLYSTQVRRDEAGHFAENGFFQNTEGLYDAVEQEFPCLQRRPLRPKPMFYSKFMSWIGFTGFYFPFTGEANVNKDFPAALQPVTIAHELAHQRRVAAEEEANFVGIAASVSSGKTVYIYSGYLEGLTHLSNALYSADREAWQEISRTLPPQVVQDWRDNSDYWQKYESPVEEAATAVYDGYLKHNQQESGIKSYGQCVDLLVEYYKDMV